MMRSPSLEVAKQCVWALANVAGDSAAFRDEGFEDISQYIL